jgi:hypothetical protein
LNRLWQYNKDKSKLNEADTSSGAKGRLNKTRGNVRPPPGVENNEATWSNEKDSWSRGQVAAPVTDKYKQYNNDKEKDLWDDVPGDDFAFGSLEGGDASGGFDLCDLAAASEKFRADTLKLGLENSDVVMYNAVTDEAMEELMKQNKEEEPKPKPAEAPASGAMRSKLLQVSDDEVLTYV